MYQTICNVFGDRRQKNVYDQRCLITDIMTVISNQFDNVQFKNVRRCKTWQDTTASPSVPMEETKLNVYLSATDINELYHYPDADSSKQMLFGLMHTCEIIGRLIVDKCYALIGGHTPKNADRDGRFLCHLFVCVWWAEQKENTEEESHMLNLYWHVILEDCLSIEESHLSNPQLRDMELTDQLMTALITKCAATTVFLYWITQKEALSNHNLRSVLYTPDAIFCNILPKLCRLKGNLHLTVPRIVEATKYPWVTIWYGDFRASFLTDNIVSVFSVEKNRGVPFYQMLTSNSSNI